MCVSYVIADSDVAIMRFIQCSTVQGEGGVRSLFITVSLLVDLGNGRTGQSWLRFQQWPDHDSIGANGSSFAKRRRPKGANGSENGVQLLCCQRVKFGEKKRLADNFLNGGFRQEAEDNSVGQWA
jgi:hypothetical protein